MHISLIFWPFFLENFLWLNPNPEPWTWPLRTMNTLPISYLFSTDFPFIFSDFMSTRKRSFQNLYTFICLFWKPMLLPSCHPNLCQQIYRCLPDLNQMRTRCTHPGCSCQTQVGPVSESISPLFSVFSPVATSLLQCWLLEAFSSLAFLSLPPLFPLIHCCS